MRFSPRAAILLVLVNLIPLVGVVWFGWDLQSILVLYWIESGIVGVINVFKIRRIEAAQRAGESRVEEPVVRARALSAGTARVPFFLMHYGLFWAVHGLFVFLLPVFALADDDRVPGVDYSRFSPAGIALAGIGLAVSHVLSYWYNFVGRREYLTTTADSQVMAPYGRVFVLHFTVIFGAVIVGTLGSPVALIALMVAFKIAADLVFHVIEHTRATGRGDRLIGSGP